MSKRHQMSLVHRNGTEIVFLCEETGCGRRLMIDPAKGRRVVIDVGDPLAEHYGGTGHATMQVSVASEGQRPASTFSLN